ncbi:hypothetical protein RJ639_004745 [Escallonia herrerae]|uniref:Uncharacterized protein n=1 Tax=Escallonia herrerae TaxID=1293975 RepID=A0AA88W122_9ASTE|nr:hypothetical protein RJ639_004745 [Escallonia herrerae]
MAENKESTSSSAPSQGNVVEDPEDPAKSPPNSPNSSTRKILRNAIGVFKEMRFGIWTSQPDNLTGLIVGSVSVASYSTVVFERHLVLTLVFCQACYAVLQSWVSKKFMTGCVVLFPVAVTFFVTRWFIQFFDGFFSPIYERLGLDVFVTSSCYAVVDADFNITKHHRAKFSSATSLDIDIVTVF